jgi:hypothetical protein
MASLLPFLYYTPSRKFGNFHSEKGKKMQETGALAS